MPFLFIWHTHLGRDDLDLCVDKEGFYNCEKHHKEACHEHNII